jgi:hypothetical protein
LNQATAGRLRLNELPHLTLCATANHHGCDGYGQGSSEVTAHFQHEIGMRIEGVHGMKNKLRWTLPAMPTVAILAKKTVTGTATNPPSAHP